MCKDKLIRLMSFLFGLLLFISACSDNKSTNGDNDGNGTASESIGPEGGSIMLGSTISMTIPAGALDDTIDFAITVNNSPTPIGGNYIFVSPVYTIGPSGAFFPLDATISLTYIENSLAGADESEVLVFSNSGSGWEEEQVTLDASSNTVSIFTDHLSDFAAVVDTSIIAEGVFAAMAIGRTITNYGGNLLKMDLITARFDSSYGPCDPVNPIQVGGVSCNDYDLVWQSEINSYMYMHETELEFIEHWGNYVFDISAGNGAPAFKDSIIFPGVEPYVTSPATHSTVSLSGFNVEWENGIDSGYVNLFILDMTNDTALYVQTDNDGLYSFDSDALSEFSAGLYSILLITEHWDYIDVVGIDPRSFIRARVINTTPIILQ